MLFKDFFKQIVEEKAKINAIPTAKKLAKPTMSVFGSIRHRQQHPLGQANSDGNRKHLNLVPAYVKSKGNKKIEDLKKMPRGSGREYVCNSNDIGFIVKHFLKDKQPIRGQLYTLGGKMGIQLYYDNNNNCWKIKK